MNKTTFSFVMFSSSSLLTNYHSLKSNSCVHLQPPISRLCSQTQQENVTVSIVQHRVLMHSLKSLPENVSIWFININGINLEFMNHFHFVRSFHCQTIRTHTKWTRFSVHLIYILRLFNAFKLYTMCIIAISVWLVCWGSSMYSRYGWKLSKRYLSHWS